MSPDQGSAPSDIASLGVPPGDDEPPVPVKIASRERRHFHVVVLLTLSAAAVLVLGRLLWPFLTALVSAVVLGVLAYPGHRRLRTVVRNDTAAALLGTILLFLLVFVPVAALSVALFQSLQSSADAVAGQVEQFVAPGGPARTWLDRAAGWLGTDGDGLAGQVRDQVQAVGSFLAGRTVGFLSGLGGAAIQIGVAVFTLFYLLRDGEALAATVGRVVPLDETLTNTLMARSGDIIHATMYGNVLVGFVQGALGGLAFWAVGVPGPVLWGAVMAVLGMLPIVGTPVVWGPAALLLLVQGQVVRAVALAALGALVVSTIDNVLRATVVGDRASLHPLVVFFSVLGGVLLFGVVGLFVGPIIFVLAVCILDVTRAVLDPDGTPPAGA